MRTVTRPTGGHLDVRPLTGADERSVGAPTRLEACRLAARVASLPPRSATEVPLVDIDAILRVIHEALYGDRVSSEVACRGCEDPLEVLLSLGAISEPPGELPVDRVGEVEYAVHGARFRLPTTADVIAVDSEPSEHRGEALRSRLLLDGELSVDVLDAALDEVACCHEANLEVRCERCGATTSAQFLLHEHLLRSIAMEQRWLIREIHLLASSYGWPLADIERLTRTERRQMARLIQADRAGAAP